MLTVSQLYQDEGQVLTEVTCGDDLLFRSTCGQFLFFKSESYVSINSFICFNSPLLHHTLHLEEELDCKLSKAGSS